MDSSPPLVHHHAFIDVSSSPFLFRHCLIAIYSNSALDHRLFVSSCSSLFLRGVIFVTGFLLSFLRLQCFIGVSFSPFFRYGILVVTFPLLWFIMIFPSSFFRSSVMFIMSLSSILHYFFYCRMFVRLAFLPFFRLNLLISISLLVFFVSSLLAGLHGHFGLIAKIFFGNSSSLLLRRSFFSYCL